MGQRGSREAPGGPRRSAIALLLSLALLVPAARAADTSYGPVDRNETLWSVARKVSAQSGGTIAQVAWALYEANPTAFDGAPARIRAGAVLRVPDAAAVRALSPAQAYERLSGGAAPAAVAPGPPRYAPAATPIVTKLELQPQLEGEPHQWLVLTGSGFAPGATLEFRDAQTGARLAPGRPQSIRDARMEYAAAFPKKPFRWEVAVSNPGGRRSDPRVLDSAASAGPVADATAVDAPGVPAPAGAAPDRFAGSAEAAALLELAKAGASSEARYQRLAPLEERFAGDADYDYPLGTLALDTGRFSEAVFVLQRAVTARPAFSGARMELARAYYALGDNESARREFATLKAQDPPEGARRAIEQYLDAIDQRAVAYEAQQGVYAELASGYDTNANGAPDLQNFIGFTLDARNQSTASPYYGLGIGGALSQPLAPSWRAVGNAAATWRANPDASFVDSQAVRLGGGVEWRPGAWTLALVPNGAHVMLDGEENHQLLAADGSAAWGLDDAQLALNLRYAQQRYAETLSVQDIDTVLYGVSVQSRLDWLPRLQYGAAATAGTDEAVEAGSPFGRDIVGLRAGAFLDVGFGSVVSLSVASLEADYDGAFFGEPRTDEQFSAAVGFESGAWRATGWRLRLQAAFIDNASTVELYDYDRIDAGLALRKEFK